MIDPSAPLGHPTPPRPDQHGGRQSSSRPPPDAPPPYGTTQPAYPLTRPGYGPPPPPAYGDGSYPGPARPPAPPPGFGPPAPEYGRRRAPRSDPGGLVAGLVIAGLGLFFLAGQLEPDIGRFVTLFIGLALLAVFVVRREYGFLVPGSILTGVGIGIALQPHMTADTEGGVMLLAIAGGFLGIWLLGSVYRLPQNHWWPLIPGGILTLIGLVQLSRADVGGAIRLWPIILIVLGAIVVGRALLRRG